MYCARHRVIVATLCFGGEIFTFQRRIHIPALREQMLLCDQSTVVHFNFFEGETLCIKNWFIWLLLSWS